MTTALIPQANTEILDLTHEALLGRDVLAGMGGLRTSLRTLRAQLPSSEWQALTEQARRHPVHGLLLESPFTRRAFAKPRGYAGDAVLMDLIYGAPPGDGVSALGGMLYGYEFDSPCFQSVRTRRALLAREIDDVAATRRDAEVVAIACGHLREVEWSRAARKGDVAITAVDQDRDSLALVARQYGACGVTVVPGTVSDLLRRSLRFAGADLVYAAGLYDYLADDVARALTTVLFRMLRSGGRLFIANFTPETLDAAFMEAIMDWRLVYRTAAQLEALTACLSRADVAGIEQFSDANSHVAYMRVMKR